MKRSGLADSPLFSAPLSGSSPAKARVGGGKDGAKRQQAAKQSSNHDTTSPRNHDTTVSWYHDTIIEPIRRAVKEFGKEAATHRFTLEEKKAIADIIYTYKRRGIKTSENEIARIAINFAIQDFRENGENSVLAKVLEVLNG